MKQVYSAANLIDAQLCRDLLESNGIETMIKGGYLMGGIGELPVDTTPSIWVLDDRHTERARILVGQFEVGERPGLGTWNCPQCGETLEASFSLCWKCGAGRTPE